VFRRVRGELLNKGTLKDCRARVDTWAGRFSWTVLSRRGELTERLVFALD
jgi:hypothetical protein